MGYLAGPAALAQCVHCGQEARVLVRHLLQVHILPHVIPGILCPTRLSQPPATATVSDGPPIPLT